MERTLIILKPDCVQKGFVGRVVQRFEEKGFRIVAAKMAKLEDPILEQHYSHLKGKPFFPSLLEFMKQTPVIIMALERENAVALARGVCGVTDSKKAEKGTVRGDYGTDVQSNIVHASDSVETAEKEIARFFAAEELCSY